ncbi:hypothetical protein [Desertibacillus haloalkaliphilus]|uniref:hypothetical protein n=1 Tax=Desertibacillus haloalkaliphilus TaxID=1328930 RepID=UPI001C26F9CE|nr:hypothetical protein [Desertibacillus haloalkaliphilus]MBU8906076.1 hypothetical protein [Desertibacillus haloalkaliphilus]
MANEELSYMERMEKLYVLKETQQLLLQKLGELKENNEPHDSVEDDLRKIEQEIDLYTGGIPAEEAQGLINESLINPATLMEGE